MTMVPALKGAISFRTGSADLTSFGLVAGDVLVGVVASTNELSNDPPAPWVTRDIQGKSRLIAATVPAGGMTSTGTFSNAGGFQDVLSVSILAYSKALPGAFTYQGGDGAGSTGSAQATAPSSKLVVALFAAYYTSFSTIVCDPPLTNRTGTDANQRWSGTCAGDAVVESGGNWTPTAHGASGHWDAWTITFKAGATPPCRLYPREDGLGTSSATRQFPRPRGQQTGFRQTDYY